MSNYVVATIKEWNLAEYEKRNLDLDNDWYLIDTKDDLSLEKLDDINPKYIFFPHWSWIVPEEILNKYTCVCFHMTDVPYGRGGSPLQNLIARGHTETKLTALQMTSKLDAGPVYYKTPLSLHGSATEIFIRSAKLTYDLMEKIIKDEPVPIEQLGEAVEFERRKPEQSFLNECMNLEDIFNTIRMLDAEGYPRAKLKFGDYTFEFSRASIDVKSIEANVKIYK